MSVVTATLENWYIWHCTDDEFVIYGDIHNDINKRWEDGHFIHTSGIKYSEHTPENLSEGNVVKTCNSVYALGKQLETGV